MRPYAQYCPIAKTAEIIGDRWSILILRDMVVGARRFNDIARGLPGISRALLSKRLRQLEADGVVVHEAGEYRLTVAGEDLRTLIFAMADWGARWAFGDPDEADLDPDLLVWWMHRNIDHGEVPARPTVVEIAFTDRKRWYWLVIERGDVSVCYADPGLEVDIVLRTDVRTLYRVWLGKEGLRDALSSGAIALSGDPEAVRAFPGWLLLSPARPAVVAAERLRGAGAVQN